MLYFLFKKEKKNVFFKESSIMADATIMKQDLKIENKN